MPLVSTTDIKQIINNMLSLFGLKIESLTADTIEYNRFRKLQERGHFDSPVFVVPESFNSNNYQIILESVSKYINKYRLLASADTNDVQFSYDNQYFSSPDAEVLYAILRDKNPRFYVEVGCGNSTKIARQAIIDGALDTRITSIDPYPRTDIKDYADEIIAQPVEFCDSSVFDELGCNDVLFIDSSHIIQTGNDVVYLYNTVIPKLPQGVIIHIHDIFLPYDYPEKWIIDGKWNWNEQYLVQCMLMLSDKFEVLWPGYYLQKKIENFSDYFSNIGNRNSQSLWLRKVI